MLNYEKFYSEVEEFAADVTALVNVLSLYYQTMLYYQSGSGVEDWTKFIDWMYIINRYANEVRAEMSKMMKRNM